MLTMHVLYRLSYLGPLVTDVYIYRKQTLVINQKNSRPDFYWCWAKIAG